jgi:hypothetical protein
MIDRNLQRLFFRVVTQTSACGPTYIPISRKSKYALGSVDHQEKARECAARFELAISLIPRVQPC